MRRDAILLTTAGALGALTLFGAGAASAADTLSWSTASATTYFCNFGQCGSQPLLVAGHSDSSGTDFNASALVNSPHGTAFAAADAGSTGLLADLHALVATPGPAQTPGQVNFALAMVQGVQVYQWTGAAYDLDPTMFVGSFDYHASYAPDGPNGILAGFAILDMSVLADNSAANPWYNFGLNSSGGVTGAFQGDCSTPGAVGIASGAGGLDKITSAPGVNPNSETLSLSFGASACGGKLHLNTGDEFVLWSKMFVERSAAGVLDASHTFHVSLDPNVSADTVQTLVSNVQLQSYDYVPAPEPVGWALMLLGFGGLGAMTRRRRATAALRA